MLSVLFQHQPALLVIAVILVTWVALVVAVLVLLTPRARMRLTVGRGFHFELTSGDPAED